MPLPNQDTEDKVEFYPPVSTILPPMDGNVHDWVPLVSSGGVTKSLLGTMLRVKCTSKKKKVTDGPCTKTDTWFARPGHSQPCAGPDVDSEDRISQLQPGNNTPFWVSRMIFPIIGIHWSPAIPKRALVHGLFRDE